MTDRQVHEELARSFAAFSTARAAREIVLCSRRLDLVLEEWQRRFDRRDHVCTCEECWGPFDD